MSERQRLHLGNDVVELGDKGVVERAKFLLGGERHRHLPYAAISSVRVEKRYSWVLVGLGLLFLTQGAATAFFVDGDVAGVTGIIVGAVGVLLLVFAMVWARQTLRIETASDDISKKGGAPRSDMVAFAEAVEERV